MQQTALAKRYLPALLLAILISPAAAQLSEEAQRDLLLLQMAEAAMALEHVNFLELLDSYEASGGLVEPEMRYYEALALADTGEFISARNTITDFINNAGAAHPLYRQALELFNRVQPEADALESVQRAEAAARAEAERLRAQRVENLPYAPLFTALEDGQRLLQVERFSSPSPWEDGSSPQDFLIRTPGALHRSEVQQGLLPRPDGGWIAFGQRPLPDAAPEAERERSRAAILNGTHAPQSTFYPQSSILRFDAEGNLQSSHHIDWRQIYVTMLYPHRDRARRMGIRTVPVANGMLVTSISPIRITVETSIQAGDIITHIERSAVTPSNTVDSHLTNYRRTRDPRFRILRNGERLDLEVPFASGGHISEGRPGAVTSWPYRVMAYVMDAAGMRTEYIPTDTQRFPDWSSDIIAMVPGTGDNFTLCANIDMGYIHGGLMQIGVLLRGRFDDTAPGGVLLEDSATINHDQRRAGNSMWWYDSGLLDCVGLPEGGLLTVSRATRVIANGSRREPNSTDFFDRYFRVYDAYGRFSVSLWENDENPTRNPRQNLPAQPYYALQPQLRFQPVMSDDSGRHWHWLNTQWYVEYRGTNPLGFALYTLYNQSADDLLPALLAVSSPSASELDAHHELILNGENWLQLLPRHAADHVHLKRVAQRADGSYVALLGVTHSEIALGQSVPGGILGDINGPKIRDYLLNVPDRWLQAMEHLGGQEDFLIGLSASGELLWSLRLQPDDPVEATFNPPELGWDEEHSRVAMQEWTNLAVLEDDSILVTMRKGHGLRIREQ